MDVFDCRLPGVHTLNLCLSFRLKTARLKVRRYADPEVMKNVSCSTQLGMELQLLMTTETLKTKIFYRVKSKIFDCIKTLRYCIYLAYKC